MWEVSKGASSNSTVSMEISCDQFNYFLINVAQNIFNNFPSKNKNYCDYLSIKYRSFEFEKMSIIQTRYHISAKKQTRQECLGHQNSISELLNIAIPLTKILKFCLNFQYLQRHKFSKSIPLHKKGSHDDCKHFRPIAIIPILRKVFEKVLRLF